MSRTESDSSLPHLPPDSPGSSVSSQLQEEYNELLKYAVVLPNYNPSTVRQTLADSRSSFAQFDDEKIITVGAKSFGSGSESGKENRHPVGEGDKKEEQQEEDEDGDVTPRNTNRNADVRTDEDTETRISPTTDKHAYVPLRIPKDHSIGLNSDIEDSGQDGFDEIVYTASIDPDVGRMEALLDQWTLELKRNVLAEFSQSKIRIVELSRQERQKDKERDTVEKNVLINELENVKELLHTYEMSIQRKDEVISNLSEAMQKQRDKYEMAKKFAEWKVRHNDLKREAFASNLAANHYKRTLCQKVWAGWHSIIETKWKCRVERACQAKAQEVCRQLTNDYQIKINSLNEALDASRDEVSKLLKEREKYEEAMKKAFMRGVCALNLEAMTMFQGDEEEQAGGDTKLGSRSVEDLSDNFERFVPDKELGGPKTIPQEPIFTTHPAQRPPPRVITSQGSRPSSSTLSQAQSMPHLKPSTSASTKGRVITAKITGRTDCGKVGKNLGGGSGSALLAPPMASVIVERHQPITKQTIGHATASKYPKQTCPPSQSGHIFKRLAGQGSPVTVAPHIQTVKVVE